jgi:hypothetical protein
MNYINELILPNSKYSTDSVSEISGTNMDNLWKAE